MKLFKWQQGRQQGTEYKKFPLWCFKIWKFGFDAYILRYEAETKLSWHRDPVKNGEHWRMNVRLWGYDTFLWKCVETDRKQASFAPSLVWFRPDITWHMLQTYTKVIKLSFGFVKFK